MQKTINELLKANFINEKEGDIMLAFKGIMSQETLVGLGEVLRSELHQNLPLNKVNKIFGVFIEMTQNVLHYSHSKSNIGGKVMGVGTVIVSKSVNGYQIFTVNKINEKQRVFLEKKLADVNSLSEEEIKDNYLSRRKKQAEGDSKGAGLGFIDMVRRSQQPVSYFFEPDTDDTFHFFLGSRILID